MSSCAHAFLALYKIIFAPSVSVAVSKSSKLLYLYLIKWKFVQFEMQDTGFQIIEGIKGRGGGPRVKFEILRSGIVQPLNKPFFSQNLKICIFWDLKHKLLGKYVRYIGKSLYIVKVVYFQPDFFLKKLCKFSILGFLILNFVNIISMGFRKKVVQ